jgi:hypothetical protein
VITITVPTTNLIYAITLLGGQADLCFSSKSKDLRRARQFDDSFALRQLGSGGTR